MARRDLLSILVEPQKAILEMLMSLLSPFHFSRLEGERKIHPVIVIQPFLLFLSIRATLTQAPKARRNSASYEATAKASKEREVTIGQILAIIVVIFVVCQSFKVRKAVLDGTKNTVQIQFIRQLPSLSE